MKIGIIGSGMVGQQLAAGFTRSGNHVTIGTRDPAKLAEWLSKEGAGVQVGSPSDAAAFGEILVLCVKGMEAETAVKQAGISHFDGKILIEVTNPLIGEREGNPRLGVGFPDSNGARVQKLLPKAHVVKAFNTVPATYMAAPKLQEGVPDLFIAGNDAGAKQRVAEIATKWGWHVNDVGGIEQAALLEALAMLWIVYGFRNNHWTHAFKLLKK